MRFTLSLQALSGLVALTALVTASPLGVHQDDFADLPTVEMKWKGPPGPGLEHTTLNGTAESIYKQLQAINPDYYPQDLLNSIDVSVDATTLDKRKFRNVDCNYAGQLLGYNEIRYHFAYADGIKYLRKLTNGYCGAEPKSCARVSCSWHSAIRLCNPTNAHVTAPCPYLGDLAQRVMEGCTNNGRVAGRAYDDQAGINVLVSYDLKC